MRTIRKAVTVLAVLAGAAFLASCTSETALVAEKVIPVTIGDESGTGEPVKEKKSFASAEFDSIQVISMAMEVYVTKTNSDRAVVELDTDQAIRNPIVLEASIQNRELDIRVKEKAKYRLWDNNQSGTRKLTISLPAKVYNHIRLKNDFGLVNASDIQARNVSILQNSGTIRIARVHGDMVLETANGDIIVDDIRLDSDLSARTDVGDIRIQLNDAPQAAKLNLSSTFGIVTSKLQDVRYSENDRSQKVGTIGSEGFRIEAHAEIGDILVSTKGKNDTNTAGERR